MGFFGDLVSSGQSMLTTPLIIPWVIGCARYSWLIVREKQVEGPPWAIDVLFMAAKNKTSIAQGGPSTCFSRTISQLYRAQPITQGIIKGVVNMLCPLDTRSPKKPMRNLAQSYVLLPLLIPGTRKV